MPALTPISTAAFRSPSRGTAGIRDQWGGQAGQGAPAPGERPDFSDVRRYAAGVTERPDIGVRAHATHELAYHLIRVLDDDGAAVGAWDPGLDPETLRRGLRAMMLTRAFDDRMYRAQRQ